MFYNNLVIGGKESTITKQYFTTIGNYALFIAYVCTLIIFGSSSVVGQINYQLKIYDFVLDETIAQAQFSLKAVDQKNKKINTIHQNDLRLIIDNTYNLPSSEFHLVSQSPTVGLAVVIGLDISGSMAKGKLGKAVNAAKQFLRRLEARDRVSLYTFSDSIHHRTPFMEVAYILPMLDTLTAGGQTALYNALYDAMKLSYIVSSERRAIIMLTDGNDTESEITLDDCIWLSRQATTPVFTIGLGTTSEKKKFRQTLGRLSKVSGGVFYFTENASKLETLYEEIRQQIISDYRVVINLPNQFLDNKIHYLKIVSNYHGIESTASISFASIASDEEESEELVPYHYLVLFGVIIIIFIILIFAIVIFSVKNPKGL